ncbi:MAG: hypothetical protein U5O16_06320 [Rhodococcus sp. (in: high G+C Gram-positive bacteria)]|uniref:hypothetical protein n=1 Tax=Rhodococcus sp. TaxID=1831 RepID=UPI002ADC225E|nr:hypothetical protein [Rhodococcus sp. (in: high G+C Gram-positive bacteria)]
MLSPVPAVAVRNFPSFTPQFMGLRHIRDCCAVGAIITFDCLLNRTVYVSTRIWYVPAVKPVNTFDGCHVVPPLMEYSIEPCAELAVIVIEPSVTLQSVTFVEATFAITGDILLIKVTSVDETSQELLAFLTLIWYEPPANPVKLFDACQFTAIN